MNLDPSAFVADQTLLETFGQHAEPLPCSEDRVLFEQGGSPTGAYLLLQGEATISMHTEAGEPMVHSRARSGSILGLPGLICDAPYTLTVVALAGARVLFVARDKFMTLMHADPLISMKVLHMLAAEVRTARCALGQV